MDKEKKDELDKSKITIPKGVYQELLEESKKAGKNVQEYCVEIFKKREIKHKNRTLRSFKVEKALQAEPDEWIGVMKIKDIVNLIHLGKINYDFSSQNHEVVKKTKSGYKTIVEAKEYELVDFIYEVLENKKYIPYVICLNVFKDGNENIEYKDHVVTVHSGEVNVIDGWHRVEAFLRYVAKYENTYEYTLVMLTNFDEHVVQDFREQLTIYPR
ncbi:hypothetical protein [Inediibacterium massiliense]|uniref:hypothetical protein n=1 Tax=Inediibacterium massiliense TaxID=1658111 RepID=UPI0006B4CD9F|nr:hypothetical protein [Inediibacterium massiliense]